jgi:hypothetical protein
MTAPIAGQPLANIGAAVGYDLNDASGIPVVLLKFTTGGAEVSLKIDARKGPEFIAQVAQGVIHASQEAMVKTAPRLLTPPAPGQIIIPPGGLNGHRQ